MALRFESYSFPAVRSTLRGELGFQPYGIDRWQLVMCRKSNFTLRAVKIYVISN